MGLLAGVIPDVGSTHSTHSTDSTDDQVDDGQNVAAASREAPLAVYGDAAYGAGALLADLEGVGAQIKTKVQPPVAPGGRFAKDRVAVETETGTVTCPAGVVVPIRAAKDGR